jgi:pyridoxine 4-dehydrogenase
VDPAIPLADQVGELKNLQDEGKIVAIGLSQVTAEQLVEAQDIANIATVQSRFNVADRREHPLLSLCEQQGIVFIPWAPMAQGGLQRVGTDLDDIAKRHDATIGQVALAWLLSVSDFILPIPGTSRREHLEENLAASRLHLTSWDIDKLSGTYRAG